MSTIITIYEAMLDNLRHKNFMLLRPIWQAAALKDLEKLNKEVDIEVCIINR